MTSTINGYTIDMKAKTKTAKIVKYIAESGEFVKNRGHLSVIIRNSGIGGNGATFNSVAKIVEDAQGSELGNSAARDKQNEEKNARARAYQMSVADVRDEIKKGATGLFWACWKLFREEGKWKNSLKTSDFAVNFK